MVISKATKNLKEIQWGTSQLRLTLFPSQIDEFPAITWWNESIGGLELEPVQTLRAGGKQQEIEADYDTGKLTLSAIPMRIDWKLNAKPPMEEPGIGFAVLGDFEEKSQIFTQITDNWLRARPIPLTSRLAFGATLIKPVSSQQEAYQLLATLLGNSIKLDVEESSDLLYQINRPRKSEKFQNVIINRLSRWAALKLDVNITEQITKQSINYPPIFACLLEIDINTAKENVKEFEADDLPPLFWELVDLGKEIAEKGDIK